MFKLTEHKRDRSILAFFATSLAQRGIGIICNFAQVPIALHYLGSEAFGLWVTLMTLNLIVSSSDFGIGLGVQNRIAEALGADDSGHARKVFVTGLCSLLGIMVLLIVTIPLFVFIDISRLLRLTDPELTSSLLWIAGIWCLNIPLGLGQRLAQASQLGWMSNIASSVSQLLMLAIVSIAAWLKIAVSTFFVLTFGSSTVIALLLLLYLLRHLGWLDLRLSEFRSALLGDISRLGILFFIQQLSAIVMFSLPLLILSVNLGSAAVTSYNLVQRDLNLFMIVTTAFLLPLWPAYADAKVKSEWPWIRRTMLRSLFLVCCVAILPMIAVGPFVQTIVYWWTGSGDVVPPQSLIWLLIAWNALSVFQQPFGFLLVGLSEIKRVTVCSLLSAMSSLAMILFLIPKLGVNAVPIGLIVGFVPFILCGSVFEAIALLLNPHRPHSAPQEQSQFHQATLL